jgi:disulfide bond formation protein DsbB
MRKSDLLLFLAWLLSLLGTLVSLFFSEFMKLPPCNLCWYQRICMYPLVLILGVGFSTQDSRIHLYSLPLIGTGWLIALYHNLLYYKVIPEKLAPCSAGASCTDKQLELFGFLTIPLMSILTFSALFVLISIYRKSRETT